MWYLLGDGFLTCFAEACGSEGRPNTSERDVTTPGSGTATSEGGAAASEPEIEGDTAVWEGDTAVSEGDKAASDGSRSTSTPEGVSTATPANTSTTWEMEGRAEALGTQHACSNVHRVSDITCPSGAVGLFGLAPLTMRRGT